MIENTNEMYNPRLNPLQKDLVRRLVNLTKEDEYYFEGEIETIKKELSIDE